MSRRSEPGEVDSWSVLKSDALKAQEVAGAPERIQRVLDKHPKKADTPVTPETKAPVLDTRPVVVAPTPPPDPLEAKRRLKEMLTQPGETRYP